MKKRKSDRGRMRPEICASVFRVLAVVSCVTPSIHAQDDVGSYVEYQITDGDRLHWSFEPLADVMVPSNSASNWRRNEIDDFIETQLAKEDLQPQPPASKATLIRRLSFDLVGLPPTPQQIDSFTADQDDDAYGRIVERLLASPHYGQRWAQRWLDLARFAETDGFEHDKLRPDAWKYRDWVIKALNEDLPYDEFISLQIAGDELHPGDAAAVTATRFCLSGPDMPDINLEAERRHTVLNELTATIGEVVLGLQIGCAQCHDHKYDPISQADFYRFRAAFEPALQLQKNKSLTVLSETFPYQQASYLMTRGDFRSPGPEVQPGLIRVLSTNRDDYKPRPTKTSAGLRSGLADWLVSPLNPLTARVIVNRVWASHFGTGIVPTPSEFGVMGDNPSNQELLDWLALYLMEHDWSLKSLHRLIVTSAVYRQRSLLTEDATRVQRANWQQSRQRDPTAELLSRFPRRRLDGEAIRDAMLLVAGQLNLKAGGPGVRPPLPSELTGTLLKNQWKVTPDPSEHNRRSIYVFARRNLRYPIFEVFDRPSANSSCAARVESTTAPQSLHLLNSEFSLKIASEFAASITADHAEQSGRIDAAFRRALGRPAEPGERAIAVQFLARHAEVTDSSTDPLTHLCLSLLNSNEFVFID